MAEPEATNETSEGTFEDPCPCRGCRRGQPQGWFQKRGQSLRTSSSFLAGRPTDA